MTSRQDRAVRECGSLLEPSPGEVTTARAPLHLKLPNRRSAVTGPGVSSSPGDGDGPGPAEARALRLGEAGGDPSPRLPACQALSLGPAPCPPGDHHKQGPVSSGPALAPGLGQVFWCAAPLPYQNHVQSWLVTYRNQRKVLSPGVPFAWLSRSD